MHYPLDLRFKILAFGQRVIASDAQGKTLLFVKQKLFKLREQVEVFSDVGQSDLVFRIEADRIIDFSANYSFTDAQGNPWGGVRRKGMRSIWAAHYEVMQDGRIDMVIREESPIKKILESVLGGIPLLGLFAIYLINPTYLVTRPDGTPLLKLIKRPAILEGRFVIEKLNEMPEDDELRSLMAILMIVLLERGRG